MNTSHKPKGVLLFPVKFQLRQDKELPPVRTFAATKRHWRAREIWRAWLRSLWAPFVSGGALFRYLSVLISLVAIYRLLGEQAMIERSLGMLNSVWPALLSLPVWAIGCALYSPFSAVAAERKKGGWDGERLIYFEPKLLVTTEFKESDNGKEAEFEVDDIPAGTVVDYKIEIDGPVDRVNSIVCGAYYVYPLSEMLQTSRYALRGKVVVRKDRTLRLKCHSLPGTVPVLIRVYALSWAVDPGRLIEFTDESKGVRIVVGPPDATGESKISTEEPLLTHRDAARDR
jgi:hypothetical protein